MEFISIEKKVKRFDEIILKLFVFMDDCYISVGHLTVATTISYSIKVYLRFLRKDVYCRGEVAWTRKKSLKNQNACFSYFLEVYSKNFTQQFK